jgi:hypothetical protein
MLNTSEHWLNAIDFIRKFEISVFESWHNTHLTLPQITYTNMWIGTNEWKCFKNCYNSSKLHLKRHP